MTEVKLENLCFPRLLILLSTNATTIWNPALNLLKSNEYGDQATYKEGP